MKLIYLTKRWPHHSKSGGYDQLARHRNGARILRRPARTLLSRPFSRLWWTFARTPRRLLDYVFADFVTECRAMVQAKITRPDAVHVLYGDEQLDLLLRRRKLLGAPLVVSFHLPQYLVESRFAEIHPGLGSAIDAAVVLARTEVELYERWIGKGKVHFVPHGIDVDAFRPGELPDAGTAIRVAMVGTNYRDWATARAVIDDAAAAELPVTFDVVVAPEHARHFEGCGNVALHHGVSEDALLAVYRRAALTMLPVLHATANNAALESLACGTPVIATAVGGMPDYVSDASGWFVPADNAGAILSIIQAVCRDPSVASAKRQAARERALEFDWAEIAQKLDDVYAAAQRSYSGRSG